jgi:hypothetical protein
MFALPPKADIAERDWNVRFVPKADIADRRAVSCRAAVGAGLTRPVPFSFWIDRTSSEAFVRHRSLLEAC